MIGETPLGQYALEYLRAGLRLLALDGKKPNGRVHGDAWSWEDSFHGVPETEEEWEAIGTAFSSARGTTGIAILIPPDFLVADVDSEPAAELLVELGWSGKDTDSAVAKTRNGVHVWFYAPGINSNRWLGERTLLFKGLGGYVVAPPSEHPDGGRYEWLVPLVEDGSLMMPDLLPPGVRERFFVQDQIAELKGDRDRMTTFQLIPEPGVPWWQWRKEWDYQTAGLEKAIENAADGNQNNIIHWAALTAKEEGVPYDVAMERLLAAAIRGHHPRRRAIDTIKGAYKKRG